MLCAKAYYETEIFGTYYVIEQGQDISAKTRRPVEMEFGQDGQIFIKKTADEKKPEEKPIGKYLLGDESRISVTLGNIIYEGVVVQLNDEAGNPTMCLTGVGSNQSMWAVRYL